MDERSGEAQVTRRSLLTGGVAGIVAVVAGARAGAADDPGGIVTPLASLKPVRGDLHFDAQPNTLIAGKLWRDAYFVCRDAVFDLGGAFDLFEAWIGIDDGRQRESSTLDLQGDGKALGNYRFNHGEPAKFIAVPVSGVEAFQVAFSNEARIAHARLVKGRTQPAQARDLNVADGEVTYIDRPGDYRVHVVPRK